MVKKKKACEPHTLQRRPCFDLMKGKIITNTKMAVEASVSIEFTTDAKINSCSVIRQNKTDQQDQTHEGTECARLQ